MNKLPWALYLIGSALVFGSWIGVVDNNLAWVGWLVASGIAAASWLNRSGKRERQQSPAAPSGATTFTQQEQEAARDEMGRHTP